MENRSLVARECGEPGVGSLGDTSSESVVADTQLCPGKVVNPSKGCDRGARVHITVPRMWGKCRSSSVLFFTTFWESRIISVHFQKTSALGSFNRKVLEHNNQDKELPQKERRHTVMPLSKSHTRKYKHNNMMPSASSQHTPAEILNEKPKFIPP